MRPTPDNTTGDAVRAQVLVENEEPSLKEDLDKVATWSVLGLCVCVALSLAFPSAKELPRGWLLFSDTLGYAYTAAWSYSFYPQVFLNQRRRSVVGLSLDFQMLNLLGFGCYAAYNAALFFSSTVQREYTREFSANIPVGANDVVFAVHAFLITAVTLAQCAAFERGGQRFRSPVGCACAAAAAAAVLGAAVVAAFEHEGSALSWMHLLYALSCVKLVVSLTKYIPQVVMNHRRKTTAGWNIWNVLLDFGGGMLSLLQIVTDSAVTGDWQQIAGNPVKFGLGFTSIAFDIIFMLQHYLFWRPGRSGYQVWAEASPSASGEHSTIRNADGNGIDDNA